MEATTEKFRDIAVGMLCCLIIANVVTVDVYLLAWFGQWMSS